VQEQPHKGKKGNRSGGGGAGIAPRTDQETGEERAEKWQRSDQGK
jgi:hypothetical protein